MCLTLVKELWVCSHTFSAIQLFTVLSYSLLSACARAQGQPEVRSWGLYWSFLNCEEVYGLLRPQEDVGDLQLLTGTSCLGFSSYVFWSTFYLLNWYHNLRHLHYETVAFASIAVLPWGLAFPAELCQRRTRTLTEGFLANFQRHQNTDNYLSLRRPEKCQSHSLSSSNY